jgi:DNA polymerase
MDEVIRARLRLWLRSEQAFGLQTLKVPALEEIEYEAVEPQAVVETKPQVTIAISKSTATVTLPQAPSSSASREFLITPFDRAFDSPIVTRPEKIRLLRELDEQRVKGCTRCRLAETRTQTVFGEGDPDAQIFFIGEGPGEKEDLSGRPFVGPAGHKLDEMIGAMGLTRGQVYIANIVKCRPPGNRAPAPDETETCTPYLQRQIEIVRPRVIVTLGLPAMKYVTGSGLSISRIRGTWQSYRGIKVMPTFHPSYILRNYTRETRLAVWSDLQKVMNELGLKPMKQGATSASSV